MSHPLFELTNINVFTCDELSWAIIEIVFEISYVLMHSVCEFAIALLGSIFVLPFIKLVAVQVEPIFIELVILNLPQVDMFSSKCLLFFILWIEFDLLAFVMGRSAFSEEELVLVAVVHYELVFTELKAVIIVLDDEAWEDSVVYDVRNFLVVKL